MDIDGGYSWLVLICCGFNYMIIAGSVKSFGILYTEFLDYFGTGAGDTAWISSVCTCFLFGLGPISNFLGERYTYRVVMFIGSCFVLVGYTASAFVPRMEYLFLTYGLVVGIGFGLLFAPCSTIVNFYFDKKRGLANGLMVAVSGFGALGFPYMYRWLFEIYGLRSSLLLSGALFFHSAAASLLLRQPPALQRKKEENNNNATVLDVLNDARKRMFNFSLFKNPKFAVYFAAIWFQIGNFNGNLVALPGQAYSLGLGKDIIALTLSVFGGSEIITRSFLGWFSDKNIVKRTTIFMISSLISSIIAFILPSVVGRWTLVGYAVLMGAFSGSVISMMGVIIFDCLGKDDFSPGFGLLSLTIGLSVSVTQPPVGWLKDGSGSWSLSFYFIGIFSFISFLLCLAEPSIERVFNKSFENNNDEKTMNNMNIVVIEVPKS